MDCGVEFGLFHAVEIRWSYNSRQKSRGSKILLASFVLVYVVCVVVLFEMLLIVF